MVNHLKSPVQPFISTAFIQVSDLGKSAVFYSMIMGISVLHERLIEGPVYWMDLECRTGLNLDNNSRNKQNPDWDESQQHLFMLQTENIETAYEHVLKMEAEIVSEIENPHPGLAFFRFRDPDGNVLMVTQSDYWGEPIPRDETRRSPIKNRIKAVFVNVTDMKRAVKWYSNLLGVEMNVSENPSVVSFPTEGGCELLLDSNRFLQGDDYKTLLMFDTDDVDKAYRYLKENNIEIFTEIEKDEKVSFFTFKDLDGNVLMVCQEHKKGNGN